MNLYLPPILSFLYNAFIDLLRDAKVHFLHS